MTEKAITFKFLNCLLKKLSFSSKKPTREINEISIDPKIGMSWKCDNEKSLLAVSLALDINEDDLPFMMSIVMEGIFELDCIDVSDERKERLAIINCGAVLFPFVREVIANITMRTGNAPLLLPSVNFFNVYNVIVEDKKKATSSNKKT